MMNRSVILAALSSAAMLGIQQSRAQLIAFDDFNRAPSQTLGSTPVGGFTWAENELAPDPGPGPDQIRVDDIFAEHPNKAFINSRGSGTDPSALLNLSIKDVELSAKFSFNRAFDNYIGCLLYRFPGANIPSNSNTTGGYGVDITQSYWDDNRPAHSISLRRNHNTILATYTFPTTFATETNYELKVKAVGNSHKVYLDGNLIIDFTDNTAGGDVSGNVGFGAYYGNWYLDDFSVSGVGTPGWKVDADGNWTNAANWTGAVPNAVDAVATFGSAITAARAVTLDAPQTAGTILFNNNNAYTIGGSSTLTLDTSSGNTAISVSLGSHTISAPIAANDSLDVSMPAASVLTLSGGVTGGPGLTLNKSGAGKLAISSLRTTNVNVNQGTVQIVTGRSSAKTSNVGSLVIAFGSTVDLGDNDMVLKATPIADVKNNLSNGYDSGLWTGIGMTSSVAAANTAATHKTALGYATASQLGVSTFSGQSVSGADVCVRYTYYGDANLDGKVNTSDFNQLAGSFGTTNKDWVNGDFNYDGAVNSQDFNALSGNYGMVQPASAALGSVVPEPATLSMVFAGFGVFMRRRRA